MNIKDEIKDLVDRIGSHKNLIDQYENLLARLKAEHDGLVHRLTTLDEVFHHFLSGSLHFGEEPTSTETESTGREPVITDNPAPTNDKVPPTPEAV